MSERYAAHRAAPLGRRSFLTGLAATLAACSRLVSTVYPKAPGCSASGCTMVDVHCHVFNASDLNVSGFVSHILPVPRKLTTWLTDFLATQLHKYAPEAKDELAYLLERIASRAHVAPSSDRVSAEDLESVAGKLSRNALLLRVSARSGDVLETLQLIVQRRSQITVRMSALYPQIDLFTPALVDYAYWSLDQAKSPLTDQLRVQAALARASTLGLIGREGVRVHPLAPFNPLREVREKALTLPGDQQYAPLGTQLDPEARRAFYPCVPLGSLSAPVADAGAPENAETEPFAEALAGVPAAGALEPLRHAIERLGFIGAKVYPPTGFKPIGNASWSYYEKTPALGSAMDAALHAFYAYCETEQVPVMTHANNSNGYNLGYGTLTGPDAWEEVLSLYPKLRLNLGHFGELEGDDPERGLEACELWMARMASMMQRYPNVYADSGCSLVPVEQEFQERYLTLLEKVYAKYDKVSLRFMYGSDFWLNKFYPKSETFVDAFVSLYQARFPQHARNFLGDNALRFLGFLDDNGHKPPDNRNRLRLKAWYGQTQQPAWLAD